ncbi:TPA: hypothetical protein U8251_001184 [Pseudomonas putida]|nr:hypothetical protein [Pseudomonas putida]
MNNPSIDQKVHQLRGVHVPLPKNPNSVGSWDDMYIEDAGNGKVRIDVYGTDPQGNPRHSVDELDEETYEKVRADLLRKEQATLPAFSSIKSGNTVGRLIGETAPSTLPAVHANPPIEAETEEEGITGEQILDGIQIGLDVIGLLPVVGEAADVFNAGISLARGDYIGAALSLSAAIPFVGWGATAGKAVKGGVSKLTTAEKTIQKPPHSSPAKPNSSNRDGAKIKGSPDKKTSPPERPSWRDSETDIAKKLEGENYRSQVSFKDRKEVPYGTKGSVRPEQYKPGSSIEVKNYNVETLAGRRRLTQNVSTQAKKRVKNLPEATTQKVYIDVRGQNVSRSDLNKTIDNIVEKSNKSIKKTDIEILR